MFSRAAKSVVNNFGQRNYHAGKSSLKNTRALVLAAERSRVPGIRTTLVEQTAEKPVLNSATTSEQNGLVAFQTEKNSLNEKHSVTNEDVILTLGSVRVEAQEETRNTCESSLPQGLELPKSEVGELLCVINKLPAKEEPITDVNLQLRSYPVSNFSQHLGISKQKTETWGSVTDSVQILGEMGPSSHSRSCYSRADFEVWLPDLLEYCRISDIDDTGFHGCSHYSPPSVRRKSKKIKNKSRRKKTPYGRGRESTSAKGTAIVDRGVQLCSTMVCRHHGPGFNQAVRKRKIRRSKACHYSIDKTEFRLPKIRVMKISTVGQPSSSKKSQKRFLQKCNIARENKIIPAILTNRKPNLLHSFDSRKKTVNPKLTARVSKVLVSAVGTSKTLKNSVAINRPQSQTVSVKTKKNTHVNYNYNKKPKPKRIPRYSIEPKDIISAARTLRGCPLVSVSKSVDNTDGDVVFDLDVESLSTSCTHESQPLETPPPALKKSSVNDYASTSSAAVSRIIKNSGVICRPESIGSSTQTSCCASLVSTEPVILSIKGTEGESEDGIPDVVQKLRTSTSSRKIEQLSTGKLVSITSTSLTTIPPCILNSFYESLDASEFASGEPEDLEEKSDCKKLKKFRSGFGRSFKALSRCGISKKKKKYSEMKIDGSCKKIG